MDRESTYQLNVVAERAGVVHSVPLAPHHLQEVIEGGLVIVEDKNVLSSIDKLLNRVFILSSQLGIFIRRCAKTTFFSFSKELLTTYITPRNVKIPPRFHWSRLTDESILRPPYLHHQVLAPPDELIFCVNNRLEKSEILQDNNLSNVDLIAGKTIPS